MSNSYKIAEAVNHWTAKKTWGEIFREAGFTYRTEMTDYGFELIVHETNDKDNVYGVANDVFFGEPSRWMDNLSEYMMKTLNTKGMSSIDKQKFVSEVQFQGDYQKMLKEEIIPFYERYLEKQKDTHSPQGEPQEEPQEENNMSNNDTPKENTVPEENTVQENTVTEDNTDVKNNTDSGTDKKKKGKTPEEREAEALAKWHNHLVATSEKFIFYYTKEGSRAWAYKHSPSVVTIGSSGELVSEVRNVHGDFAIPLKKDTAEAIIDKLFLDLAQDVRTGEVLPVKRVNRFYSDSETGTSWVYTANADTEKTPPFIKINSDGVTRGDAPEGIVFDSSGDLGEMEVDLSGTVEDFWKSLNLINLPKEDRLLALGWLMTPVHATDSARPGLLLRGGAGSGKTSTAVNLKDLIDPDLGSTSESLAPTGEKGAFLASLRGSDTKIPGNLSGLSGTMSDAISQAMTGSRYERDEKYTENKLSWELKVSMIFSTINTGMVLQGDLQSRVFPIDVPEIPEHIRAMGDIVEEKWNRSLPKARGGLLKLISEVKGIIKDSGGELPVYGFRMIPAAKAMSASEIVLTRHNIEYTPWGDRYGNSITKLQRDALPAEIDFLLHDLDKTIEGRPGEVLQAIKEEAFKRGFSTSGWKIKSAKGLAARLEENVNLLETRLRVFKEQIPGKSTVRWVISPMDSNEEYEFSYKDDTEDVI